REQRRRLQRPDDRVAGAIEADLHGEILAAIHPRGGVDDDVVGEGDTVLAEEVRQGGGPLRVDERERVAGTLQVAIEGSQLVGQVVLLRSRDHQHGRPDRDLVAEQGDRDHLVVLLLQEDARRGVPASPVVAHRVALAVPGHPGDGLVLLASHLEDGGHQGFLPWVREDAPASLALDYERAVGVHAVFPRQRRVPVHVHRVDVHPAPDRPDLAQEVVDEGVARVLRAQEGEHADVAIEATENLARVVRERVAPLGREIEAPRPRVEQRLSEKEDPDQRRDRERDAQRLAAQGQRRPRHCLASSTRSVPQAKQPARKRKKKTSRRSMMPTEKGWKWLNSDTARTRGSVLGAFAASFQESSHRSSSGMAVRKPARTWLSVRDDTKSPYDALMAASSTSPT